MAREWKARNRESVLEWNRQRNAKRYADPVERAKKLLSDSNCRKRHLAARNEYDRNRDKVKARARYAIRGRVYRGTLERKPCEVCGKPDAQAHHEDYNKPLEVKWVCSQHHKELFHAI